MDRWTRLRDRQIAVCAQDGAEDEGDHGGWSAGTAGEGRQTARGGQGDHQEVRDREGYTGI